MHRVLALLVSVLVAGCALVEDEVPIGYVAPANLSVVSGASEVAVEVAAQDRRVSNRDRISTKKNGYGMEMAAIKASNDVVALVGTAVERELASLGFKVGPGGIRTMIEVDTFYNDFKVGFFSGDAVAEVAFTLKAFKPTGEIVYSRSYRAVGMVQNIMLASGENARPALEQALTNAMAQMIQDADLHRALVSAGGKPTVTSNTPTS